MGSLGALGGRFHGRSESKRSPCCVLLIHIDGGTPYRYG